MIRVYNDRKSYYQRGRANFGLKEYELAISDYDKAISLSHPLNMDPDNAYIYYRCGLAKKKLGQLEEAKTYLQEAGKLAFQIVDDPQFPIDKINDLLREINSCIGEPQ